MSRPPRAEFEPSRDCPRCPRLVAFREDWRQREPAWFNAPVPAFGGIDARLLIVGLAPGLHGANRTGRPFTGDYAGELLYPTLLTYGFARGTYRASPDDGLALVDCRISNAVRCVPPQNKPVGAEISTCRDFLIAEMQAMPNLIAIIALGRIAHESVLSAIGVKRAAHAFGHASMHKLDGAVRVTLFDSYHCSRYNTNTGRLTEKMFHTVFAAVRTFLDKAAQPAANATRRGS